MKYMSRRNFFLSSGALCASAIASSEPFPFQRSPTSLKTGYAFDNDFASFENNSAETYLRAEWINSRLDVTGVRADLKLISPYPDPMEYIKKLHTQSHISIIDSIPSYGDFTITIGEAARLAVGHVLGAVKAVCDGTVRNAFCCIRPPGHHVQNSGEMGYCCYANIVLAAKFAREKYNIKKILIIDWDYHQGNGTHGFICGDDDILFFETYNPPMYTTTCDDYIITGPDYSFSNDARRINVRMPHESKNNDFVKIFESKLVPAAERFKPELVLISCGFDLKKYDSHGSFYVTAKGISRLTRIVRQIADTYAGGKLVSMLEGGYVDSVRDTSIKGEEPTFSGLSQCAENHVKTLITGDEYPETPFFSKVSLFGMHKPRRQYWNNGLLSGLPKEDGPWNITITECNGRIIKKMDIQKGVNLNLDNLNLPAGHYLFSLKGKTGKVYRSTSLIR